MPPAGLPSAPQIFVTIFVTIMSMKYGLVTNLYIYIYINEVYLFEELNDHFNLYS